MRRTVTFSGAVFALLCLAMILFALPAGAQDDGIPPRTDAIGFSPGDNNNSIDLIEVDVSSCDVTSSPTSITLEDVDGMQAIFSDRGEDDDISISTPYGHPTINGPRGEFIGKFARQPEGTFSRNGDYLVVNSTNITCEDEGENTSSAQGQYADDDGEVDEAEDVIVGTTSSEKIPNTGGPPLLVFGVLLLGVALLLGRGVLRP